ISASRQKFSQQATEPDKSARSKLDTTNDVHLKTKKVDLGQLIQKFSGSESNSEKSETEAEATTSAVQRPWVRRQKAEEIHSSSEDSEGARRTPERTQSLRRYGEKPPDSSVSVSRLEKSASFRSEFMSRRLAQNTSELTNQFGKTKEVTPPPKEATPPLKDTHYLREASPLKTTSGVPLASERTLKLDNKTKDLSDSSSVGNVPNNASENAHSRNDPSSRAIFNSIRNFSPEPGSTLQKAPSSISSDTKLTDSTLASLGNRAWISGASRRSNAPSQTEKLDDKRKKDNAFETVGLPGKETSTSLTHPATSTTKNDLGKDKKPVLTTLDKSLELLSKVTEELDHPEQPSSLPPSPLDITSPRDKSRSPSIDDAQRYIREVETSIASISPRSSPEKTKDSNSLSSRFTYKFHDENKALEERKQQIDIHSVRDTKSSDRDMKLVDKGLNEKTVSDRSRDLSSRERDTKSQECDLKSQELSFKIRDRDIKSQERDIKSQERDIKSRERDPKLQERDIRTQKLETKTPDRDIKSQDLNIKSQDRDTKTPERDIKSQERDIKSQDCDTKRPEHNIKSQERDIKSQDRDTKRPEHNIKSQDRDIKSQDRDTKTPERNIKLHEGDPKKSNLTNMVKSTNVHQLQDAETGIDLVSQKIPLQPSPSSMASSIAETSLKAATVSAQFSVSSSSGMSRSSSFKDATDLTEKRKGILKRASSLKSSEGSSYPIVDPQLAKILQQRKHLVGDVLEEEEDKEDKEKKRTISATEEIQENLKYSMQKAAEQGRNPEEDEALKRMSVAERVQYMQHKMEEEKYAASASRSRSGMSTPRSRPVSGLITPTQFKYEGPHMSSSSSASSISALATVPGANSRKSSVTSVASASDARLVGFTSLSGPQLIEKLTEIAEASEAFQERRHRFQQRNRNDWRHQTQPVTLEEINAADSLETVSAFRALVRKKTSINAFDQLKDQSVSRQPLPLGGKKAEFPQHLTPSPKNQRRGRRLRHRTLPVTAEELNAVPENQMLIMHPEWAKTEDTEEKRDSKADSGILSGSDVDLLHEQSGVLASDLESGDKELSKMTISARANFFKGLEEKSRADREKEKSASGAKRYIMRKKRERSQTMPVTDDELMDAAESGDGSSDSTRMAQSEVVSRSRSTSISEAGEGGQHDEDELTKLSLSEKVKLFSQLKDKEQQPPPKVEAPVKRRGRKQPSRFSTQPVTSEEVEQAAAYSRISPLAMSLVKPPDPEMLKGLPLKDQRELMAQHAEMFLSQSSLRSISRSGSNTSLSQPSSRRASVTLEDAADKKPEVAEEERHDRRGIMKDKSASTKELHEIKSILRSEPVKVPSEPEVHSILKSPWDNHTSSSEPRGILKKAKSEDIPSIDSNEDLKSILKHDESDEEESHLKPRSRSNSQPYSILKREPSPQPGDHEIRSILKTPSHENVPHLTSAMRRGSSDSDSLATGSGALKSALRHRGQTSEGEEGHTEESASTPELKSALHKPHASSVEDILDDANSHIHVDLTLSISGTGHQGSSSRTSTSKPSGASSPPRSTDRSSLEKEDEVKTISSKAPVQDSLSEQATGEKDTLKVPEDTDARLGTSASEGEGESSAGELLDEPQKRLKKKSRINRATNSERYKTQPPELPDTSATTTEQTRRKYKYEGRNKTQPITTGEMREAEAAAPVSNLVKTPGGSISERLNQLKTSGNEEWKKRVEKKDDIIPLASPSVVKLREQSGPRPPRPTSIADRLNELEVSSKTWQNRVEESDAKQFTVAAKLSNNVTDSPLVNKLKNLPKKEGDGISPLASPVTPTKEFIAKIPLPKDIVHDPLAKIQPTKRESESEDKKEPVRVEVPNVSEELQTFFNVKTIDDITDRVELTVDDFDNIFIEAENILPAVHKIKPQRKARPTSLNPLKYMKVEILNEYLEVTSGVAEKELRRVKREGLAKDAGFAEAALAGLASKENFKQVELRRTDSGSSVHGVALEPYKDLMLFHVKGRRTVQTRVVEPHTRSVNSGDCYVLVTPDKVLQWEGQFANVIEKAKASEIASCIQTKKELCCKRANEVLTVYQSKDNYGNGKLFWSLLEGERQSQVCGPDNEDELYEASITKANMIYRLEGNALLPYTEYWGDLPKYEMLQKNEVIVFDFGTEFYLWQGKSVGMEQRKLGLKLAKQLFEKGYDYTESAINPLSPLRTEEHGGLPLKADKRPPWVIFGKVSQNMETILFREKFADWPDSSRMIGVKGLDLIGSENTSKDIQELKPYDATLMLPQNSSPVTLKLEGSDLGRGLKWAEDMQGFVKEQDIITISVATWHVLEYEHFKLDQASLGQFHEGDTYVVRWQYMIASANLRNVKGLAKNIPKGRERCAYFFWQGSQSTINEKGASALMTVELDEERGPQVRVLQGKEIPCFLNLFNGKMVVHIGKREDPSTSTQGAWRLFCVRGDYENETCLVEIPVSIEHLRSRSSLLLLNVNTGIVYIWHGCKSPKHTRELVRHTMDKFKESPPAEFGLHKSAVITITEVEEGEEKREIWAALDSRDRQLYHSLLLDPKPYTHTIRLFHMSSVNMVFEVHEQLNPSRVSDLTTPYPFLQSDLYKAAQPALFLVDNAHEVYLWQGWFPVGSHDTDNVNTGSATARFNMDRKCAMETTLHYCKVKNPTHPPTAYLVCAGVEPECFTTLFPVWTVDTVVQDIALEEGKSKGYKEKVSEVHHRLTKTKYTLAELQERPLPEGVEPMKLEFYLEDVEFEEILGMKRDEFYAQPAWKQRQLKIQAKLF
ncbi:supervillin, partial [Biomphalaria glabrata]